ncbi:MAG: DNA polymerase/3'-5' exonuclease PolX [Eubacteriales bacterium]
MQNIEVAWVFYELADLLEFKGEDFFKVRAYRNAARVLAALEEPLEDIRRNGRLAGIPGIGKNIAAKIEEILSTGGLKKHRELLQEIPPGLLEIASLPGIGPKKARLIRDGLMVASLDELYEAAGAGRLRKLPGMGAKSESEIIRNIDMQRSRSGRVLLATARELAEEMAAFLRSMPGVNRVEVGGSVRRWRETVRDVDLVASAKEPGIILEALAAHPRVLEVLERKENFIRVLSRWNIPVNLIVAPAEDFWLTLHKATGSREHYRRLGELAPGVGQAPGSLSGAAPQSEEEIYRRLGLPFIPPELRENRGEIGAARAGRLPRLIEPGDIRGDLHLHTSWSDGQHTLAEMAARAKEKGYSYIAVTDHSQSLKIAHGLSLERLREQIRAIADLNEKLDGIRVLTGIEVDILPGGGLDCPDSVLKEIDVVVASVHSAFKQDRETITSRIISAVINKHVDIIGHLTGRLIGQREGYALDVDRVLEAAAKHGAILEINSSPDRLDLNDTHARLACEMGVKLAIDTDAHDRRRMDEIVYGVAVARRAWLEAPDVVNTMPADDLIEFLNSK